ncbi:hypothetical protein BDV26DRAFT_299244 [Aspergillus bertholletiae]|uniref:Uncharacterized protein n=1 Tax=Aspergillus bertholletiae TaxID=1226010 RepID=A0A5N7AMC3_9EURO|nr:hypothetical protein BDV26DRAFT_299244 [Aspergillus bertholletiae]
MANFFSYATRTPGTILASQFVLWGFVDSGSSLAHTSHTPRIHDITDMQALRYAGHNRVIQQPSLMHTESWIDREGIPVGSLWWPDQEKGGGLRERREDKRKKGSAKSEIRYSVNKLKKRWGFTLLVPQSLDYGSPS